jgi:hypothetical protein
MYSFTNKEENMSTLASLKLTNSKKPTAMPPVQIQFARAQQNGENFTVKKFKTVKDLEGNRKSVEINKRVRPWWYVAQDGKVCLNIRYGARIIEFVKGKSAVEVNSPEELIKALEIIKGAVEAGELDSQIEQASGAVKAGFRR